MPSPSSISPGPSSRIRACACSPRRTPSRSQVFHHSSAHLLAAAVLELFPETKLGHGPATETGFFYDFLRETPFTPEDLEKIEAKMKEIADRNEPFAPRLPRAATKDSSASRPKAIS